MSGTTPAPAPPREGAAPWWAPGPLAVSFLTVLPAHRDEASPALFGRAVAVFPLVGLGIGLALGVAGLLLDRLLPPDLVAVALLALGAILTGGLHLDGLADTADGVFAHGGPARRLEIMRDSRIGTFGAVALGLALLGQFAALSHLAGGERLAALAVAGATSRWALAAALVLFPAASRQGLAATAKAKAGWPALGAATVLAAIVAAVFGATGGVGLAAAAVVALAGGSFLSSRLGGLNGDACGALAVLAETAALFCAVAVAAG